MWQTVKSIGILAGITCWCLGQEPARIVRLEAEQPDRITWHAPRWRAPGQRRIALSLRGGAAKGLAHIGVLQRFEEEGLPVDAITGTSAGAFVAALAASGFSGANQVLVFQAMDFSALLDDRRRSFGVTLSEEEDSNANFLNLEMSGKQADMLPGRERTQRVQQVLFSILGHSFLTFGEDFDRMRIPIRIVATDLQTGDPWVFRNGSLAQAVQASMTIPGLLVPLEVEGHQLADGGLVGNLPVEISRKAFPGMVQVGVDISRAWDDSRVRSLVGILNRSLDASMRQNELRSMKAADLLLTPRTDNVDDFDFHNQVQVLVSAGRKAFDERLPDLEALIYGPDGERIATAHPLEVDPAGDPALRRLAAEAMPPEGPIRFKDLFRLLRRLHQRLPLVDAWVEVPADPSLHARLYTTTQPIVRRVDLHLPEGLSPQEIRRFKVRMDVPGLRAGEPFSPAALDACLAEFPLYSVFPRTAYLRFTGTAFVPATGVLTFQGQAVNLEPMDVHPEFWKAPFHRFFRDMVGQPLRPGDLLQRIDRARIRFGISRFGPATSAGATPTGVRIKLFPERETSVSLALAPAYENSWGTHLGIRAEVRNPFGIPVTVAADGAVNSLLKRGSFQINRELTWLPGFGYTGHWDYSRQRFGDDLLLVQKPPSELRDLVIRHQDLGFGLWARFGGNDHGMVRLGMDERQSSFTTTASDSSRGLERTVQASVEWDDLDFHTLPREGSLLRIQGGRSFHVENGIDPFKFGYVRLRHIVRMPALPFSLDFDAEAALGWDTPIPRWYTLGGGNSIIGTRGAAYLLPNAAIGRFGVPFSSISIFGIGVQAVPRLDWGRFSLHPNELSRGPRIFGKGLVLRSIVRSFQVELSFGQTESRGGLPAGTRKESEFTLLVGTRPFDLWHQR